MADKPKALAKSADKPMTTDDARSERKKMLHHAESLLEQIEQKFTELRTGGPAEDTQNGTESK